MTQRESHPIPDKELDSYKASAEKHLKAVKGKHDIEEIFRDLSPKETYRTLPDEVRLTFAIRRGVCHYFYFVNLLLDRTGQKTEVQELKSAGRLEISQSVQKKTRFSSAYAFFVMANSIFASCNHYLRNQDQSKLAHLEASEFDFVVGKGFNNDLSYMFSYYADALFRAKESGIIQETGDTISVTRDFWQAVIKKAIEVVGLIKKMQGYSRKNFLDKSVSAPSRHPAMHIK